MPIKFYVNPSVRCVDEIDIGDTKSYITRAILFPESPSAFRSCELVKEEELVPIQFRAQKHLLPSPDNSSGEEDSSHDERVNQTEAPDRHNAAAPEPLTLLLAGPLSCSSNRLGCKGSRSDPPQITT